MKIKKKEKIVGIFKRHLASFHPELSENFVCPTCLESISEIDEISEAHIVPAAAGGRKVTLICRKCNSMFGAKQDRWWGDKLKMDKNDQCVFESNKEHSFEINGRKFSGKIDADYKTGVEVYIDLSHCAPGSMEFLEVLKNRGESFNLSLRPPILGKDLEIRVGYLTAGYLAWFDAIGYSWALQSHLGIVREQILNPDKELIQGQYSFSHNGDFIDGVQLLVVKIHGLYLPAVAIGKQITMLPTPNVSLDRLSALIDQLEVDKVEDFLRVIPNSDVSWSTPMVYIVGNDLLNFPDCVALDPDSAIYFYYPELNLNSYIMVVDQKEESYFTLKSRDGTAPVSSLKVVVPKKTIKAAS